jgi:hemerythrin-like domain-containing protein
MKITEHLNSEHGVFLTQLRELEILLERKAPPQVLSAVLQTIARAVATHRDVEEEFLYPAMQYACAGPIQVMEQEHETIEAAIRTNDVRTFIDVLREHIMKEIRVLFPMAEECIAHDRLVDMTRRAVERVHERAGIPLEGR